MANSIQRFVVGAMLQRLRYPAADLLHLWFFHPPRGHRRSTDADSAWPERWIHVERNRILVHRDSSLAQRRLSLAPQHPLGEDIDQHQVSISSPGDDAIAGILQTLRQHLGIGNNLPRVFGK